MAARLAETVTRSVRAGESLQRIAERVLDDGDAIVRLPRHVTELRAAARRAATGDPVARREFEAVVDRWSSRVERLGQGADRAPGAYTVRSSTQRLITELREAQVDQVDRAVDRWVLDRARYQARQIARHETVEAYRDAYQQQAASNPAVQGFRWRLSPRHPRPDVCDLYANQDLFGLGPGGYPADQVPATPHPNCLCTRVAIVDRYHSRRELARLNGEPEPPREWESGQTETASEWLARQPDDFQRELLGPTRHPIFQSEPHRVITAGGAPIPVHQVLGLPSPRRPLGPGVVVRPLVEADRATMARPFPELGGGASPPPLPPSPAPPPAPPLPPSLPPAAAPPATADHVLRGVAGFEGDPASPSEHAALRAVFGDAATAENLNGLASLPPGYEFESLRTELRSTSQKTAYTLHARIETSSGQFVGTMIRELKRSHGGELLAKHEYFVIEDAFQGQRIGRHVLAQQFRSYRELGVSAIHVDAAWEGRYVWARSGFMWNSTTADDMRARFRDFLVSERAFDPGEADRLAARHTRDPYDLALLNVGGERLGKLFLLAKNPPGPPLWSGVLDLAPGSTARRRYAEYLGVDDG